MKFLPCLLLALGWLPLSALHAQTLVASNGSVAARPASLGAPAQVPAAAALLTGTVLNDDNEPVPGAVVSVITEPTNSASTNSAGIFVLHSAVAKPVLQVRCAGYIDSEQPGSYAKPIMFKLTTVPDYERQLKKKGKAAYKAYKKAQ